MSSFRNTESDKSQVAQTPLRQSASPGVRPVAGPGGPETGPTFRVSPPPSGGGTSTPSSKVSPMGIPGVASVSRRSPPDTSQLPSSPLPSIWESRGAQDVTSQTFSSPGDPWLTNKPETRRARAGTMPSRLNPPFRSELSQLGSNGLHPLPGQPQGMGSLALLSPDTSDSVWDSQSLHPRSPGQPSGSETAPPGGQSPGIVPMDRPQGRTRSDSLSALSNSAIQPFAPSIWSTPGSRGNVPPMPSQGSPNEDPMQPFYQELAKRSDPQRIRSYTLNTSTAFDPVGSVISASTFTPAPSTMGYDALPSSGLQVPRQPETPADGVFGAIGGRSRAQTVGAFQTNQHGGIALGRGGKQHQLLHELADGPIVSIEDLSPAPTTSLWVSNVPANATSYSLHALYSNFGRLEGARVLPLKQCGYVTFGDIASSIEAQRLTNGRELYPGRGPSLVGFAKILGEGGQAFAANSNPMGGRNVPASSQPASFGDHFGLPNGPSSSGVAPSLRRGYSASFDAAPNLLATLQALDATPAELEASEQLIERAGRGRGFKNEIHAPQEQQDRVYVSAVLRDVRKRIDTKQVPEQEVEEYALDMVPEIVILASDYMGNTVVQQLFTNSREVVKDIMLKHLYRYLAQTGTHKNGTWAAQKIIDVANTNRQRSMVVEGLRPHTVPLFLDQYGNYVIQGCLKFGAPWNDFIIEAIVANIMDISQGRFGARAIRACLESPHISKEQQRLVAAAIIDYSPSLAQNANGSLLITWLLDTYIATNKYVLLANKLAPHIVPLATSKLASVTLLKLMGNRADPTSSRILLNTLFDPASERPPEQLVSILSEPLNGPTFLYKLLTSVFTESSLDGQVAINKIRMVLLQPHAVVPNHKRLLEETGLTMLISEDRNEPVPLVNTFARNPELTPAMRGLNLGSDYSYGQHTGPHNQAQRQDWLRQP